MSSFTSLLIVIACAALLNAGGEARPSRRNGNDASIILGNGWGYDIKSNLPILQINGPDVILGMPDACAQSAYDNLLDGTEVIVSNNNGGTPPILAANDADDAHSNLVIHCVVEADGSRCSAGISVAIYQYCGAFMPITKASSPALPPTTRTKHYHD